MRRERQGPGLGPRSRVTFRNRAGYGTSMPSGCLAPSRARLLALSDPSAVYTAPGMSVIGGVYIYPHTCFPQRIVPPRQPRYKGRVDGNGQAMPEWFKSYRKEFRQFRGDVGLALKQLAESTNHLVEHVHENSQAIHETNQRLDRIHLELVRTRKQSARLFNRLRPRR